MNKPHIYYGYRIYGSQLPPYWMCSSGYVVASGYTPSEAYKNWLAKLTPTCYNCTSTQPGAVDIRCGMCCGPTSSPPNNKYERITFVPRHNSATTTQVPGAVRPTRTVGAKDSIAAPYGRATV